MISILIYVIVVILLVALALYVIRAVALPDPFGKIATLVVIVIACLAVIMLLLGLVDGGVGWRLRP